MRSLEKAEAKAKFKAKAKAKGFAVPKHDSTT